MEVATPRAPRHGFFRFLAKHPRALMVSGMVSVAAAILVRWATQLWGLPDIGDPFDVAAFRAVRVPKERNAFLEYSVAASMSRGVDRKVGKQSERRKFPDDWPSANQAWRDFTTEGHEALLVWRRGTEKPDAFYEHPQPLNIRTILPVTMELRTLGRLAILEGSRLETEGDQAGAWGWYRAALRSSRHSGRHGFQIERLTGAAIYRETAKALTRWASHPKVDAPLLRRALDEVIEIDAMTALRSETIKLEYLVFVNELDDPNMVEDVLVSKMFPEDPEDWCQKLPISDAKKKPIQAARVVLANDRERSLRLARLLIANWLPEADKPAGRQAKLLRAEPRIYEVHPESPTAPHTLSPAKLSSWLDSSLIAHRFFQDFYKYDKALDRERILHAKLVVHLASELYQREHGLPPKSPQELVGPYLKGLPEGYDGVDGPLRP